MAHFNSLTQQRQRTLAYVVDGKAVLAHHHLARGRSAEAIHGEHVAATADIAMPALGHAGLDSEPGAHRRRQHRVTVLLRLGIEQLPTWQRDDAHLNLSFQQLLPRLY